MPASVIDASVLGAWCFREPRAEEAFALLSGQELYAPYLLAYEVTSIARRKVARYAEQLDSIVDALQVALALRINWYDTDHLEVLKLAL
jgi:predicted nucleic acid-binding protein